METKQLEDVFEEEISRIAPELLLNKLTLKNILTVLTIICFTSCEQISTKQDSEQLTTNSEQQIDTLKKDIEQNITEFDTITAIDATQRIGKKVIVKGKVSSVYYAQKSNGKPTFLNIEKDFPNNPIAIIIFEKELNKFKINAQQYNNKTIMVNGKMVLYNGDGKEHEDKPSIIIYSHDQIKTVD